MKISSSNIETCRLARYIGKGKCAEMKKKKGKKEKKKFLLEILFQIQANFWGSGNEGFNLNEF